MITTQQQLLKSQYVTLFREDEILHAKDSRMRAIDEQTVNIKSFCRKRIGENKIKASVDDIIGIWSAIDEAGLTDQLPSYCTINISRIPVLPDEMTDASFRRKNCFRCVSSDVRAAIAGCQTFTAL